METSQELPLDGDKREYPIKKPLLDLNGTLKEINNVIGDIGSVNLKPEQRTRFSKIKQKIAKSTGKFFKTAQRAVTVGTLISIPVVAGGGFVAAAINYELNHPALVEKIDANGQINYSHPDERTTHYLNILAGRDKFTDEDLKFAHESGRTAEDLNKLAGLEQLTEGDVERFERESWKKQLKETYEKYSFPLPANIEEMSSLELAVLCFRDPARNFEPKDNEINFKKVFKLHEQWQKNEYDRLFELRSSSDVGMYGLVWDLEKESGNPRIRFRGENKSGGTPFSSVENSAYYDPQENTIYINITDLANGNVVISEMSHGKQFKDNPFGSFLLGSGDIVKAYLNSFSTKGGLQRSYGALYDTPGSLEFQAHRLIQPDLESRYPITPYLKQIKTEKAVKK